MNRLAPSPQAVVPVDGRCAQGLLLIAGVLLAALTEAIASSVLALGRNDILGDIYATPDEFAWLDVGYTSCKLIGFMAASWWLTRFQPRQVIVAATLVMGLACGITTFTANLELLIVLRVLQGLAGGTLLVGGQMLIFLVYPRNQQPMLQAVFAMGAVVAPAALAPALQGWLIDSQSWTWIFFGVVPLALAAIGCLLMAAVPDLAMPATRPSDVVGMVLAFTSLCCLAYVLGQGNRWDWFEAPHIVAGTALGIAAVLCFVGHQLLTSRQAVLDFTLFGSRDFTFAFIVSFVAGAALFGSAYLIPAFALSVLAFTPTDAGLLLLPSGALFIAALLLAACLMQYRGVAPFATVPLGIVLIMIAMWMLSGSTSESGMHDMMGGVLLRGLGLGLLFLSITLIAFGNLQPGNLASGIGLFNVGRQLGGLMGVAGLQTLIDHQLVANAAVLGAHVTGGTTAVIERLGGTTAMLGARGMDTLVAGRASVALLGRAVSGQSAVIAFDVAFFAVVLLFAVAAPLLVGIKLLLARYPSKRYAPTTG
ncbi:MFS transporter [Pseudomonas plecoglossicida]|uniref:MFS transporter n=1 Tax=Pseudomonas plecoglossicida TaxID=70775 RepID=UPI0003434452|nr:MFS transporter [Pseudomonas plecoglossicida]EPB97517.1 EmrB/QacA family drug resistance transporter [Pseudomonas plecoglossicida NB2011]